MAYIPAKKRKRTATVRVGGKSKFPIFDKHSAQSAERLKGHAKPPLTASQSAAIDRKAAKYGVHPSGSSKKKSAKKR